MESTPIDTKELVEKLKEEATLSDDARLSMKSPSSSEFPLLQSQEELKYLNHQYLLPTTYRSANGSPKRIRGLIKHLVGRAVFGVLQGYVEEERNFLIYLVRFQNNIANVIDQLSLQTRELAEITVGFHRLSEHAEVLHRVLEKRLEQLERGAEKPR